MAGGGATTLQNLAAQSGQLSAMTEKLTYGERLELYF